ncbi:MAG: S16 family serine protease [Candidatus Thorarchaeota archaeon]|jgi:uncharacterized protein
MKTRILALVVGILIGAYIGGYFTSETVYVYKERQTTQNFIRFVELFNETNMSVATINVPAVDENGNGVSTILLVQAVPGTGRAMVNIDKLLFWVDTQHSIRTAKSVAENITGRDLLYYDLVYTIAANASVIEGPSAGAALTVATIAALEGKTVNSSVVMTGTVNHDGTVGPVGGIVEKAMAAKAVGSELILVPLSQSEQVTYESVRHCERVGFSQVCTIEQIPNKVNVEEEVGIEVREVMSIEEALGYLLY